MNSPFGNQLLVLPSTDEYKVSCANYYSPQSIVSHAPLELDVGFYGMCSYQKNAWKRVIESVRQFYPVSPICIINDGMKQNDYRDVCKAYDCKYIEKTDEICTYWTNIKYAREFLDRTREACALCNTEWMVYLHPDSICKRKISRHPNSHIAGVDCGSRTGQSSNMYNDKIINYIRSRRPGLELNGWGFVGGCIFHVPTFIDVYNKTISRLDEINKELGEDFLFEYDDTMMPFLFNLCGYVFRVWFDVSEPHRELRDTAFVHGIKDFYDVKETRDVYNARIMNEIPEQQFKDKIVLLLKDYSQKELTDKALYHSYETVYPDVLCKFRDKEFKMLEIGVSRGGSLAIWAQLFPKATIYGVDWDYSTLTTDLSIYPNVRLIQGSQSDPRTFDAISDVDVVIDDASHQAKDQIASFDILKHRMNKGGLYIIEDIYESNVYPPSFTQQFDVVDLRHLKQRHDDKLFIRKY